MARSWKSRQKKYTQQRKRVHDYPTGRIEKVPHREGTASSTSKVAVASTRTPTHWPFRLCPPPGFPYAESRYRQLIGEDAHSRSGVIVSPSKRDTDRIRALMESIGAGTRKARRALQLTQEEASELIGIASVYFARIDRGHALPSVCVLYCISKQLGVSADTLLGTPYAANARPLPSKRLLAPEEASWRRIIRRIRKAKPSTQHMVAFVLDELDALSSPEDG